jgi:hypothetical protein
VPSSQVPGLLARRFQFRALQIALSRPKNIIISTPPLGPASSLIKPDQEVTQSFPFFPVVLPLIVLHQHFSASSQAISACALRTMVSMSACEKKKLCYERAVARSCHSNPMHSFVELKARSTPELSPVLSSSCGRGVSILKDGQQPPHTKMRIVRNRHRG